MSRLRSMMQSIFLYFNSIYKRTKKKTVYPGVYAEHSFFLKKAFIYQIRTEQLKISIFLGEVLKPLQLLLSKCIYISHSSIMWKCHWFCLKKFKKIVGNVNFVWFAMRTNPFVYSK